MEHKFSFRVTSKVPPVVEFDPAADAVYVYLDRGKKISKTVLRSEWPHVAVDLDDKGTVIGIELLCPSEFTIHSIFQKAKLEAPVAFLNSARYQTSKSSELVKA